MKKKHIALIAILCIVCLMFIFCACQKTEDTTPSGQPSGDDIIDSGDSSGSVDNEVVPPSDDQTSGDNESSAPSDEDEPTGGDDSQETTPQALLTDGNGAVIGLTAYGKTLSSITIPLTIEQEDITSIASSAFAGCDKLESVEISSDIGSIGEKAFANCIKLSSISIPYGVSSIEPSTFENCSSLSSVEIPNTVTSIGNYAFMGCKNLAEITIPSSVTYVASYTFGDCSKLKTIVFPDSVESIGYATLFGCYSLQSLTVPFVGGCAYAGGSNSVLGYVFGSEEFENSLLVNQSFSDTTSNNGDFYIPTSLKKVVVTKENLMFGAFSGCTNLTEVVLGEGIRRIGQKAFYGCQNLSVVGVPNSLIFVGEDAFSGCAELSSTTYNNGKYLGNSTNPYYVLLSVVNTGCTSFTAHNDTKCILQDFMSLSNLTSVSVPNGITSIVSRASVGTADVDFVNRGAGTLKNNLVYIGNSSNPYLVLMANRYWWETITIQSTTKVIATNALGYNGYNNTELVIPDSVQYIGDNNFSGSTYQYAKTVKIGSGVVDLDGAFLRSGSSNVVESFEVSLGNSYYASKDGVLFDKDFTRLINYPASKEGTSYIIPSTCKYISPQAFYGNKNITNVEMTDSVISIGAEAFYYTTLTNIGLSNRLTNISDSAFGTSKSLESVNLPSTVSCVSRYVFSLCSNLSSIEIPVGVTYIGKYAFSSCSNLTRLDIPEGVRNIESIFSSYCNKLEIVTLPSTIVSIGATFYARGLSVNKVYYNGTLEQWCKVKLASSNSNPMFRGDAELYINGEILSGQIKLSDGLTVIEDSIFAGSNITSIVIPSSVTRIGEYAFSSCSNLTIYCEAQTQPDGWDDNWNSSDCPVVWGYKR